MALSTARKIATVRAQVRPGQQSPAGEGHDQAEDQVRPAPSGGVELEGVVAGGDIELVLKDGHQPLQRLETPTMIIMIAANKMKPTAHPLASSAGRADR